jgi:hypothetical protein
VHRAGTMLWISDQEGTLAATLAVVTDPEAADAPAGAGR